MANYYVSGYTPPSGITNSDQVKALQQQLGIKADGIWGAQTQAAYDKSNSGSNSWGSVPAGFSNALQGSLAMLQNYTPQITYTPTSETALKDNISAYLRPAVDQAIANRRKQTGTNKANIDADAAARGMGASTWVTDVKNRQQNAEATDIASMESNYGATLAQQVAAAAAQERQNQLAAQQYNASAQQSALSSALSLANGLYSQQQSAKKSSSSSDYQAYIDALLEQMNQESTKPKGSTSTATSLQRSRRISGAQD